MGFLHKYRKTTGLSLVFLFSVRTERVVDQALTASHSCRSYYWLPVFKSKHIGPMTSEGGTRS